MCVSVDVWMCIVCISCVNLVFSHQHGTKKKWRVLGNTWLYYDAGDADRLLKMETGRYSIKPPNGNMIMVIVQPNLKAMDLDDMMAL